MSAMMGKIVAPLMKVVVPLAILTTWDSFSNPLLRMQEILSSNPPVVTGICDPNISRARHHLRM